MAAVVAEAAVKISGISHNWISNLSCHSQRALEQKLSLESSVSLSTRLLPLLTALVVLALFCFCL